MFIDIFNNDTQRKKAEWIDFVSWLIHYLMDRGELTEAMSRLPISLACWNYDRTQALIEGRVRPDGIDLNFITLPVEETFFRMIRHQEFDASEMSLSTYVLSLFTEKQPLIAIPIFISRSFRHSSIFINKHKGIQRPQDLRGKKVGLPEFQLTACVWIRGILSDEYGVPVESVSYHVGGEEEPDRPEKLDIDLPPKIKLTRIDSGKTLSSMLETGEIDALYSPRAPSCFTRGSPDVSRLFPNFEASEKEYYKRTGIFPIMHVVVIRRDIYEQNRWVARSLYKAFLEAQKIAYDDLSQTNALKCMLPWLTSHLEETRKLMGADFWPYGLEPNRGAIETFLRYSFDEGLAKRIPKPEEIFAKEALESFKI